MNSKDHAKLPPSSAERWMNCTGSVQMAKRFPSEESEAAAEGTEFHKYLNWYMNKQTPGHLKDKARIELTDRQEMLAHIESADSITRQVLKDTFLRDHDLYYDHEKKVWFDENNWGTVDFMAWNENTCLIIDYKYGKGVAVDAKDNWQLINYALATQRQLSHIKNFWLYIYQPRSPDGNYLKGILLTDVALDYYGKKLRQQIQKIITTQQPPETPFEYNPGEHCRFCPGQGVCEARNKQLSSEVVVINKPQDKVLIGDLSIEQRVQIAKRSKEIIKYIKAVNSSLIKMMAVGVNVPGLKLVTTRPTRKWNTDIEDIGLQLKKLGVEKPYTEQLITLTEAEAIIGKGKIDHLCVLRDAKLTLADADDPRENAEKINMFEDMTHE